MKRLSLLLVLISMAFAIGTNKGYSCPEGWQELNFDATYSYDYEGGALRMSSQNCLLLWVGCCQPGARGYV